MWVCVRVCLFPNGLIKRNKTKTKAWLDEVSKVALPSSPHHHLIDELLVSLSLSLYVYIDLISTEDTINFHEIICSIM